VPEMTELNEDISIEENAMSKLNTYFKEQTAKSSLASLAH